MIISSQRYLNDEIVAEKQAAKDYVVMLSPVFEIDGVECQTVLDGHHSLEAAQIDGVDPVFEVADCSVSDNIGLLEDGKVDDFLEACHIDDNWYNVESGKYVW